VKPLPAAGGSEIIPVEPNAAHVPMQNWLNYRIVWEKR
jgi:hypothetical protein